jgi:hypothetical protein
MGGTDLQEIKRDQEGIEVEYTKGLTPGRPCLTGRYEHENSPR